jgi:hypothetical protein
VIEIPDYFFSSCQTNPMGRFLVSGGCMSSCRSPGRAFVHFLRMGGRVRGIVGFRIKSGDEAGHGWRLHAGAERGQLRCLLQFVDRERLWLSMLGLR